MKFILSLLLLILVGCTTPQDQTPPPINNNKMTLEMQSCNKQEVGLLGCFYDESKEGQLVIPLWYKGEYQIQSERCGFLQNERFEGTQKAVITYQELLAGTPDQEKSCLFNIKVFIDKFDNGFEGFFLLEKGDIKALQFKLVNQDYVGYAGIQIKEGTSLLQSIAVKANEPGTIFWEGCKKDGERKYESNPQITLDEVINDVTIPSNSCVLTVGLIPNDVHKPVELGKVHINIYEKTVVSLSKPSLEYDNDKLTVRAEKLVAGIGIGDSWTIKTGNGNKKYSRKVSQDKEVDVRIMTSNGRFMLLKVKNGEVLWIK
jgi:hypothetical protein